jgi:CMP-2-keto-3-deoxyoctulosonic acid synthetase
MVARVSGAAEVVDWPVAPQRCLEAERLDGVVVATDDERIEEACRPRRDRTRWPAEHCSVT